MDPKRYHAAMLVATIVYGSAIGLLAMLAPDSMIVVAIAGGALVAIGWALAGSVTR